MGTYWAAENASARITRVPTTATISPESPPPRHQRSLDQRLTDRRRNFVQPERGAHKRRIGAVPRGPLAITATGAAAGLSSSTAKSRPGERPDTERREI